MASADAVFDQYFRMADVDCDGRVSGGEAVTFFRGSGLPQQTLAKVWQYADVRQAGFLTKPEFYNALRLVTVAQSGRDLNPDVVRAALSGPAAAHIPPPRMAQQPQQQRMPGQFPQQPGMPAQPQPAGPPGAAPRPGMPGFYPQQQQQQPPPAFPGGPGPRPGAGPVPGMGQQYGAVPQYGAGPQQQIPQVHGAVRPGQVQMGGAPVPGAVGAPAPVPAVRAAGPVPGPAPGVKPSWTPAPAAAAPDVFSDFGNMAFGRGAGKAPGTLQQQQQQAIAKANPSPPTLGQLAVQQPQQPKAEPVPGAPAPAAPAAPAASAASAKPAVPRAPLPDDMFGESALFGAVSAPGSSAQSPEPPVAGPGAGLSSSAGTSPAPPTAQPGAGPSPAPPAGSAAAPGMTVSLKGTLSDKGDKAKPKTADAAAAAALDAFLRTDVKGGSLSGSIAAGRTQPGAVVPGQVPQQPQTGLQAPLPGQQPPVPGAPLPGAVPPGPGGPAGQGPGPAPGAAGAAPAAQGQAGQTVYIMVPGDPKPWPRMALPEAQQYTQIFAQVDADRDGKITGEEARKTLLSFQVPIDVLKQVWNLSDEDDDGMLSLREFCTACYLIQRSREGRKLPAVLPQGYHFDHPMPDQRAIIAAARIAEAQAALAQNAAGVNVPAWRHDPGMATPSPVDAYAAGVLAPKDAPGAQQQAAAQEQQQGARVQVVNTAVGQMPVPVSAADITAGPPVYRSKVPALEMGKVAQLDKEEQEALQSRHKAAEDTGKKVWETEVEIMDAKKKIDFYRTKMQEIIMFKSRCDNKLADITEQAAAEKREVEQLSKKYDDKYKQTYEGVNRLAFEEKALQELQTKKEQLRQAVIRLEQGGGPNELLQEKADKLAMELEDLRRAVNKRAKQLGLTARPLLGSETPFGWQAGLQEGAVDWDEDWDEFIDEGFVVVRDLTGGAPLADDEEAFPIVPLKPLTPSADKSEAAARAAAVGAAVSSPDMLGPEEEEQTGAKEKEGADEGEKREGLEGNGAADEGEEGEEFTARKLRWAKGGHEEDEAHEDEARRPEGVHGQAAEEDEEDEAVPATGAREAEPVEDEEEEEDSSETFWPPRPKPQKPAAVPPIENGWYQAGATGATAPEVAAEPEQSKEETREGEKDEAEHTEGEAESHADDAGAYKFTAEHEESDTPSASESSGAFGFKTSSHYFDTVAHGPEKTDGEEDEDDASSSVAATPSAADAHSGAAAFSHHTAYNFTESWDSFSPSAANPAPTTQSGGFRSADFMGASFASSFDDHFDQLHSSKDADANSTPELHAAEENSEPSPFPSPQVAPVSADPFAEFGIGAFKASKS